MAANHGRQDCGSLRRGTLSRWWRLSAMLLVAAAFGTLFWGLLTLVEPQPLAAAPVQVPLQATSAFCDTIQGISVSECEGLVAFYTATGGDNWFTKTNWLVTSTPCTDWYGVSCYNNTIVTSIILTSNNLSGTLPAEIGDLPSLNTLHLELNNLQGPLPAALGTLAALRVLRLASNHFSGDIGAIPWANFQVLEHLSLADNEFTGSVPPELGSLESLKWVYLHSNHLTGTIPGTYGANCINDTGGMCKLEALTLANQQEGLTGTIPSSLGNLTNLKNLDIHNNRVRGEIPASLLNLKNLNRLVLNSNHLGGEIPDFSGFTQLSVLRLTDNALTGTVPFSLGTLTNVTELWLARNQLRGAVPKEVACLPEGIDLQLAENLLTVDDDVAAMCSITNTLRLGMQTVPPDDFRIGTVTENSVELLWTPIYRATINGWYEIAVTQGPEEVPDFSRFHTADQTIGKYLITDLTPGEQYYFYIRTYTRQKPGQEYDQTSVVGLPVLSTRTLRVPPNIAHSMEVTPTVAGPGDVVTYTVTLERMGGSDDVVNYHAHLPPATTLRAIHQGNATLEGNDVVFSGTLALNTPMIIRYSVNISPTVGDGSILQSEGSATQADGETYAASAAVAITSSEPVTTLILIYAAGDNSLSTHMQKLFQRAEAANKPEGMVVLLLLDDADNEGQEGTYIYRLHYDPEQGENCPTAQNRDCFGRYREGVDMWRWSENVGTYTSLKEFVAGEMLAYPAQTVVLSLVGHGSGWSPAFLQDQPSTHDEKPDNRFFGGILWDNNPPSALSTAQLGLALQEATELTGKRIDLLYLDACLMAMSEVLYQVRGAVDYLLASESTSWTAFRYDKHLEWTTVPTDPVAIGRAWIDNEVSELDGENGTKYPYTYALLNLTQDHADKLIALEDKLAKSLIEAQAGAEGTQVKAAIAAAVAATDCFDTNEDHAIDQQDYYCDLYSFATALVKQFDTAGSVASGSGAGASQQKAIVNAAQALQVFLDPQQPEFTLDEHDLAVPHPKYPDKAGWDWGKLGGVSIYLPLGNDDWKRRYYTAAYLDSAAAGNWDEFINAYYDNSNAPAEPAPCATCRPEGPGDVDDSTPVEPPILLLPQISK